MTVLAQRDATFLEGIAEASAAATLAADAVDRDARFPHEALAALRRSGALSAYVPERLGGHEVSLATLAAGCYELARACSAAGMVFAMHHIKVGSMIHHLDGAPAYEEYLSELAAKQLLVASATSEVGTGGDLRRSITSVVDGGDDTVTVEKQCTTISYALEADDVFLTARSGPQAEPGDQVLVLARKDATTLEQTSSWDVLGMRGTCSPGFVLSARVPRDHVLPTPFALVAAQTMVPLTHILWGHVWLGIATAALDRARAFVREQARARPGTTPVAAARLSELARVHQRLRNEVSAGLQEYEALRASDDHPDNLFTMAYAIRVNMLKINASELAAETALGALAVCGIAGYRNDTPFSVGRHVRDALSAALMIGNDRIHATNATLLLVSKG